MLAMKAGWRSGTATARQARPGTAALPAAGDGSGPPPAASQPAICRCGIRATLFRCGSGNSAQRSPSSRDAHALPHMPKRGRCLSHINVSVQAHTRPAKSYLSSQLHEVYDDTNVRLISA